jgi:trk system potassium uptake protein
MGARPPSTPTRRASERARARSVWQRLTPPQLFIASFAGMILLGTVGFRALPGLYIGEPLSWLDAFFTATSAICVTGLIVVDTATHFTARGQAFLLVLIQAGGLGMITFTTMIILGLGRRLSLRHEVLASPEVPIAEGVDHRRLTFDVVRFAILFEAVGATILYLAWGPRLGWGAAAWPALFHAVSAFCNAGFSTFSDSVMPFATSPITLATLSVLIIAGGLGFLTIEELHSRRRKGVRPVRLSVHSSLVLGTTALLLVSGAVGFLWFEWSGVLGHMGAGDRLSNAFFMSVTARTAGFNSVDYAVAGDNTNFLTILLMSIGGSPGSAAGGLKTTTVALIALLAFARLRGSMVVSVRGRSVPNETVQRAVGLFALGFAVMTLGILGLVHTGLRGPSEGLFLRHMFEAVSAFNTVGLSIGATPELSTAGRWLTIILMFVGRVGPLTVAAALARRATGATAARYSYEDVVVG